MNDLPQDLYPSRGPEERWLERLDPVIYAGEAVGEQGLSGAQLVAYVRDGFLVLPGVFSREEARLFEAEFLAVTSDPVLQERDELVLEPDDREPRTLFSPDLYNPVSLPVVMS
jgi:ectoine hydroxylase